MNKKGNFMKSEPSEHERREKMWITRKHRRVSDSLSSLNTTESELL